VSNPSRDPSVFDEPHQRGDHFEPDPGDMPAARARRQGASEPRLSPEQRAEQGVWDEPGRSPELSGSVPANGATYRRWLLQGRARTGMVRSWAVTLLVVLAAGPWAVLGALMGTGQSLFQVVVMVVLAPVAEETMKIAAATYIIEKRPFLFVSPWQIALCGLAGGLVFAAIENLLYLEIYVSAASEQLAYWRWTVCVGLHMGCSLVASLGLVRVWRQVWQDGARPRLTTGFPCLLTAVIIHGAYNAFAVLMSASGVKF
jgi:RsiW-degrading membrane proteinase PrsW (M82 family)